MYEYRATLIKVVDGDTIDVTTDLGFHVRMEMKLRLYGINAPELTTTAGKAARAFLSDTLPRTAWALKLKTQRDKQEKYGRYLATVFLTDGTNVNDLMVDQGHARIYLP